MAKKYNVELEVLSSLHPVPGTKVKEAAKMEQMLIKSVAKDANVARVMIVGLPDEPGIAFKIFSRVAKAHINVDIILQSVGRDGTKDITFTVPADKGDDAVASLQEYCDKVGARSISYDTGVTKISVVGAGMETRGRQHVRGPGRRQCQHPDDFHQRNQGLRAHRLRRCRPRRRRRPQQIFRILIPLLSAGRFPFGENGPLIYY